MDSPLWFSAQPINTSLLKKCALAALLSEIALVIAVGFNTHRSPFRLQSQNTDSLPQSLAHYVEAEMVQMPAPEVLVEKASKSTSPVPQETTLSKTPGKGKSAEDSSLHSENIIQKSEDIGPLTHGILSLYTPKPVLPSYLQNEDLSTHVIIDCYVSSEGIITPRLVNSSGNEEIDALALSTVQTWKFAPAQEEGKRIDSKIRLRIVFEVK